jgi:phospho-N-acetylmuramoyl-pentapeptide-transferase
MLYLLANFAKEFSTLNIFSYITFRTGGAMITAFLLILLCGPFIIRKLSSLKIGQTQRGDGPKSHISKNGTPTMGGIMIIGSFLFSVLLWARLDNRFIWVLIFTALALSLTGFYDDYVKFTKKDPGGMPSALKLAAQGLTALAVVAYLGAYPPSAAYATSVDIPYLSSKITANLSLFYSFFAVLMIIGSSNATNLTDGLDGLASGSVIFCAATYAAFAYLAGNAGYAEYLKIIYVPQAGEIAVLMGAFIGANLGFLWFNAYPAKVFMGDTGSLFMGGVIAAAALCVKQELILAVAGGIFVAETLSVIMQMGWHKISGGRRIFKMAPFHHHFEIKGVEEPKVIVRFWIAGFMLMLLALASLKIR